MDVLLINCYFEENDTEPLGLCYLASSLRQLGIETTILNPSLNGVNIESVFDEIQKILHSSEMKIIGMSVVDDFRTETYWLIQQIASSGYKGYIILGGVAPTLSVSEFFTECEGIDIIVLGEGEIIFRNLVQRISNNEDWKDLCGIAYRKGIDVIVNPQPELCNFDHLPIPARDVLVEKISKYGENTAADLISSRGCYGKCSFCAASSFYGIYYKNHYRNRSIPKIVQELRYIYEEYNIRNFRFSDDAFIMPGEIGIQRIREFYRLLKMYNINIKFSLYARIDAITEESIALLTEVGLNHLFIGVESISEDDLSVYNKNIKPTQIFQCMNILSSLGYSAKVDAKYRLKVGYITFHPFVTLNSLRASYKFCKDYDIPFVKLMNKAILYKGTELRNKAKKINLLIGDDYIFFDPLVGKIYNNYSRVGKKILFYRNNIRDLEKTIIQKNISPPFRDELRDLRIYLDRLGLESFVNLVNEIEINHNIDHDILTKKIKNLEQWIKSNQLLKKLQDYSELIKYY